MTIEKFAEINNMSRGYLKNNISSVIGVTKNDLGEIVVPEGSRYPFDVHRYRFDSIGKRMDAILEATYKGRYIDHKSLKMEKTKLDALLRELLEAGLLREKGTNNPYGANKYDTTIEYEEKRYNRINKRIKMVGSLLATAVAGLGIIT